MRARCVPDPAVETISSKDEQNPLFCPEKRDREPQLHSGVPALFLKGADT